ncbi:MAG: hypothetical protein ACOZQL_28060 [Myxococcota bacterium]
MATREAWVWGTIAALTAGVLGSGCAVDASCLTPRPDEETACDIVDAGTEWRFVNGQPLPDIEPFCSSRCVDFPGTLTLDGQHDLRKVPLLPKLRKVDRLIINVAGLPDLRGLERVDIGTLLHIGSYGVGAPDLTFASMTGLEDDAIDVVTVSRTPGLTSLGDSIRKATTISLEDTGLVSLDLENVSVDYLSVFGSKDLRSISLGSGTMESIWIDANPALETLTWGELRARSIRISRNPRLSSCQVSRFVQDAGAAAGLTTVLDNGPCP